MYNRSKTCGKIFSIVVIVIALLMAIAVSVAKLQYIDYIIATSRFFDIMLPILGVGALIKYLCKCHSRHPCQCGCEKCDDTCKENTDRNRKYTSM